MEHLYYTHQDKLKRSKLNEQGQQRRPEQPPYRHSPEKERFPYFRHTMAVKQKGGFYMGYGFGGGFDGSFILFLILILLVFSMPYGGECYNKK